MPSGYALRYLLLCESRNNRGVTRCCHYHPPVFIRIFKEPAKLELWVEDGSKYRLTCDLCKFSGKLGPKLKEGDRQAPEGFYTVTPEQMNPNSSYHLSFNLGYPNKFDRYHGRTGSALMVHGPCVSIGFYAMGDEAIEAIRTLCCVHLRRAKNHFRCTAFHSR